MTNFQISFKILKERLSNQFPNDVAKVYLGNIANTGTSDFRQVVRNTLPAVKMFQEFKNTVRMFSERCAPIFYKIVAAGRVMACHNGRASLVHFRDFGSQNGNCFLGPSLKEAPIRLSYIIPVWWDLRLRYCTRSTWMFGPK